MAGRIIYEPPEPKWRCRLNCKTPDEHAYRLETRWQCDDCGKVWVLDNNRYGLGWRAETRREKRQRRRREPKPRPTVGGYSSGEPRGQQQPPRVVPLPPPRAEPPPPPPPKRRVIATDFTGSPFRMMRHWPEILTQNQNWWTETTTTRRPEEATDDDSA